MTLDICLPCAKNGNNASEVGWKVISGGNITLNIILDEKLGKADPNSDLRLGLVWL